MTGVADTPVAEPRAAAAGARIELDDVGVRFDFDRQSRVVTPGLALFRRIRTTAWGLRHVSLAIEPGSGVALVGPTGSGKTTLLRILASVLPPDEGRAEVRGRIGSLLASDAGLHGLLTGRENAELVGVLAGLSFATVRGELDAIGARSRLGDAYDRPVHTYSLGMRARLSLGVIQSTSPDVLLLDEVFEALDHEFRGKVEDYARDLRRRGGIVVAAGHDHQALKGICRGAAWLSAGELVSEGPIDEVISRYRHA